MLVVGGGLGLTTAPATESIMGSLSLDKAGVGSAVNDTTRELGGTLGVAILGSVFSSAYASSLRDSPVVAALPEAARTATEDSVGAAAVVAERLGASAPVYLDEVSQAFLSGMRGACLVAAGVAGRWGAVRPPLPPGPCGNRSGRRHRTRAGPHRLIRVETSSRHASWR